MKLGSKIKELRKKQGYTVRGFAKEAGLSPSYLSDIENNNQDPSLKKLRSIAKTLGVSTSYLLSKFENYQNKVQESKDFEVIPVLGCIAAGQPVFAEENIKSYERVPAEQVKDGQYFYLEVTGDSMINAGIYDGDMVLVKKQDEISHKDIAVVMVNAHDATVKRVYINNGTYILHPENPKYDPIVIKSKEARIIGKVIALTRKFE